MAKPITKDTTLALQLKPTQVAAAVMGMQRTKKKRAIFLWGPPGISKSAVSQQVANALGIAFIDIRLSQMDPTDLRGIPYPSEIGGMTGVDWSAPLVMPRDLDLQWSVNIDAIDTIVRFYNPQGSNGIHYCIDPTISVQAITPGLVAVIAEGGTAKDRFVVKLVDADGVAQPGKLQYRVTGKSQAIVALEEFNSAPPSVQAAAYQLVLDKRLGDYIVPTGCYLMAMGNRDTDKGVTFKMPTPIMNRFVHIEMIHDKDDWIDWALGARVHEAVVGWISYMNEELMKFEAGTASRGFATPRSWEFVSDILQENEDELAEQVLTGLIVGCVGDASGVKFMTYRNQVSEMPDPEDILSGRLKELGPNSKVDISISYALTTTLCYRLQDKITEIRRSHKEGAGPIKNHPDFAKWNQEADNFLGFILKNFKPEIAIMGAKASLATFKLPFDTQKMKNFEWFSDRYKALIL